MCVINGNDYTQLLLHYVTGTLHNCTAIYVRLIRIFYDENFGRHDGCWIRLKIKYIYTYIYTYFVSFCCNNEWGGKSTYFTFATNDDDKSRIKSIYYTVDRAPTMNKSIFLHAAFVFSYEQRNTFFEMFRLKTKSTHNP